MKQPLRTTVLSIIVIMVLSSVPLSTVGIHTPNDPNWAGSGGLNEQYGPQRTFNNEAWDLTDNETMTNPGSRTIVVGLIDRGVNYNHEDLVEMIWENMGEIPGNSNDDDGNGYIDDVRGWDFGDDDNNPMDKPGTFHGTMTAGVIAAQINNALGIAGTARVTIMPISTYQTGVGYDFLIDIPLAIRYAADNGADVISMSLGIISPTGAEESAMDAAIEYAWNLGCLIVALSHNDRTPGTNPDIRYPARHDLVIAVGATDEEGIQVEDSRIGERLASFSNYGRGSGGEISCVAPGVLITTTYTNTTQASLYTNVSGTSFSTPHVAGALALILSYRPSLNNEEAWRILNGSCNDLMDPDEDDEPDYSDDPGYDIYSGYGLINISQAVSYANLQRDQWSNHRLVSNNSVNFNFTTSTPAHRQAVAIDSQGFSHIVWIDQRNAVPEVYYSSVEPSGRGWTSDTSLETGNACAQTASSYVDIFVDNFDNIHVGWIDDGDIYYTRLDPQGSPNLPQGNQAIIKVTNSAASAKEYLNIIVDDAAPPVVPSIFFYYNIQDVTHGIDWDVAWSRITVDPFLIFQVTFADTILIPTDSNLRNVSADVGLMDSSQERVFLVVQDDVSTDWDIEWRQYDFAGMLEAQMWVANTNDDEVDPHIDVSYETGGSAIVWKTTDGSVDELYYRLIAPSAVEFTYGQAAYQIGYSMTTGGGHGGKEFPKVAIANTQNQIPNPYSIANQEIHVVWRQWDETTSEYAIYLSRCNADGRPFQAPNETILVGEGYGYPLVTSVDEGSLVYPRYIKDGHFRATWFQLEGGIDTYAVAYRTTNPMWKGIRNITVTDEIETDADLVIDVNGDYHLAWTEDTSGQREICYANWIDSDPYSAPTTTADITHNQSNDDSYRPKIVIFNDSGVMKVTMIWIDTDIRQNGDIWITTFEAEDPSQVHLSPTNISCSPEDNNVEYDHRIAHDDQNQWIAITWCEDYSGDRALWVGVVDYANAHIVHENKVTYSAVYDCYDPSIYIEEQTQSVNIAYVRIYATYHLVYYTQIHIGLDSYSKYFDNSITSNGFFRYPEIVIDHETRRLENNSFAIRSDFDNRDRYVHIVYSKTVNESSPERHALCYQKLFLNGTVVIGEKMILPDDYWWVPTFRSYVPIRSVIRLDVDNRLEIVSLQETLRGNWWPIPSAKTSLYYTKIDNNGEILVAETFINDNETFDCLDITTAIDDIGQVHVIWTENTNLRYCSNGIFTG